jgi:hypothetical protein
MTVNDDQHVEYYEFILRRRKSSDLESHHNVFALNNELVPIEIEVSRELLSRDLIVVSL